MGRDRQSDRAAASPRPSSIEKRKKATHSE